MKLWGKLVLKGKARDLFKGPTGISFPGQIDMSDNIHPHIQLTAKVIHYIYYLMYFNFIIFPFILDIAFYVGGDKRNSDYISQ